MNDLTDKSDCKATFIIQIQFKQNCTWQGTITWSEGGKSQRFRSELELLKLMMEAVPVEESEDATDDFPAWK